MNYNETTSYLFSQLPVYQNIGAAAYKPGLDNTIALDKLFDSPHTSFKTIHVGGTNGKGSTSHTLAAILQQSGYKVGLYTSPHLVDFRERMRVDGKKIEETYVVDFVEKYKKDFEPLNCSFFELSMMMSFCYFRHQKVDIAIIEVGLGGRLDSTNIIHPALSIITNISLDHTQFLGNSAVEIAGEKAGIIKQNVPVIIGKAEGEVKDVFVKKASEQESPIYFANEIKPILSVDRKGTKPIYCSSKYGNIMGDLPGYAQEENTNTILVATNILIEQGYKLTDKSIKSGFADVCKLTGLMGRWQVIQENPKVICDTAHNVAGIEFVVEQLAKENYDKLHMIFGMANDKDISHVLEMLPKEAQYYFINTKNSRLLTAEELSKMGEDYALKGNIYADISSAYKHALEISASNDLIFIGGSNFVVGEFLEHLV